jgi:TrmH family RNA methyltransferase
MLARCDVCLVGTANPENLGGVARLLENFGLSSLKLIAPRVSPQDHRAMVVGRAARTRLHQAQVLATLDEAVAEAAFVVGFSARRGAERPAVGLMRLAPLLKRRAPRGRIALVFGPEDHGLSATDVAACDVVATVETPGSLASLNLSQAVALALWELGRDRPARPGRRPLPAAQTRPADRAQLDALVEHACEALEAAGYFRGQDRLRKRVHLRRLLGRAALATDEVRGLHGMCAQILRAVHRA